MEGMNLKYTQKMGMGLEKEREKVAGWSMVMCMVAWGMGITSGKYGEWDSMAVGMK